MRQRSFQIPFISLKLVPSLSWQIIVFHLKLIIKAVFSGLYPAWNWSVRRLFRLDDSTATGEEEPGVGVGSSQLLRYRIVLASCYATDGPTMVRK